MKQALGEETDFRRVAHDNARALYSRILRFLKASSDIHVVAGSEAAGIPWRKVRPMVDFNTALAARSLEHENGQHEIRPCSSHTADLLGAQLSNARITASFSLQF